MWSYLEIKAERIPQSERSRKLSEENLSEEKKTDWRTFTNPLREGPN